MYVPHSTGKHLTDLPHAGSTKPLYFLSISLFFFVTEELEKKKESIILIPCLMFTGMTLARYFLNNIIYCMTNLGSQIIHGNDNSATMTMTMTTTATTTNNKETY